MPRRALALFPLALAALLLSRLGAIWWARLAYPYDLEWMEGGMLAHAWRIERGLPLYTAPGPDWVPYLYPPGYANLLAAVSRLGGLDYATGRALSLVGTLLAAAAIHWVIWRRRGPHYLGLCAAAAFLGCYPQVGAFYDLVRLDGVLIGILAWSLALALERGRGLLAASALLLAVAFAFKQNVALLGLPLAAYVWHRDGWRTALRWGLLSAVPALSFTAWMQWQTHGLFLDYVVATPAAHPMVGLRVFPGLLRDLAAGVAPLLTAGVAAWALAEHQRRSLTRRELVVGGLLATAFLVLDLALPQVSGSGRLQLWQRLLTDTSVAAALVLALRRDDPSPARTFALGVGGVGMLMVALMRGHHGGFVNVLMPAYWLACTGSALVLASRRPTATSEAAIACALGLQLAWANLSLDEQALIPTQADREANDAVVEALREVEGPILAPHSPWLAVQAGHAPGFPLIAYWDVANHDRSPFPGVTRQMSEAAAHQHWGAVVTGPRPLDFDISAGYRPKISFHPPNGVGFPRTGWRTRPQQLWVRAGSSQPR